MEKSTNTSSWCFTGEHGEFEINNPHMTNGLYFPLANESGMMSAVSPLLGGDLKTSQNTFLMPPVSVDDLANNAASRNFWLRVDGAEVWSATGNSLPQRMNQDQKTETSKVEAGFLWHKLIRKNTQLGISSEVISFVPTGNDKVELMQVIITNTGTAARHITPVAAIPIYGRSADNIRDHRHVTSLLNRIHTSTNGVIVHPTLTFDERGHKINSIYYSVQGVEENGGAPVGFYPVMEDFIGEGGSLQWPTAVLEQMECTMLADQKIDGYEAIGAIRFRDVTLAPGQSRAYVLVMGIGQSMEETEAFLQKYGTVRNFEQELAQCKTHWEKLLSGLVFHSADRSFDQWMKWVELQPVLRRIYGCSFLPHHDYGKGGRGWRDLWQDCLALLLLETGTVREMLRNNYGGVRLDGSNATIIGTTPGAFVADRNNIPRTWMDHGAWPYFTTRLYLDLSGDMDFLFEQQSYFKDKHVRRCTQTDSLWTEEYGNRQKDENGSIYQGTILEHMLLEQVTSFYNVGQHNNIRLEGGDWNDGFDMADEKGESVAFTALYGSNLMDLSKLLRMVCVRTGIKEAMLAKETLVLFDTLSDVVDYDSIEQKNARLRTYFDLCTHSISGEKIGVDLGQLADDLEQKAQWIKSHIRAQEWIENTDGYQWFNGYYDNAGLRLEGDINGATRMTLTGQVFPIMGEIADDAQVAEIVKSVNRYLKDESIGGVRLNTDFNEVKLNMGRCFGFAFGHKENGAMFSHMAVMYINALYKRGFVQEGWEILDMIFKHCSDFEKSRIYPGIPEYINQRGRGMYNYLTGSASWLLLTMRNEVFGVKGLLGDLVLQPKLVLEQFDQKGSAAITTIFADRVLEIEYKNPLNLAYGSYEIGSIELDDIQLDCCKLDDGIGIETGKKTENGMRIIKASLLQKLAKDKTHHLVIGLKDKGDTLC